MRPSALLAVLFALLALLAATATAEARLFRQTYGATVPTADGGCAWNLNQDYFVPRHCDSCRYDLFSSCKKSHTISPACRHLHPVYDGYCTPYGACRYRWRDHVYKKFCGCTPLRHTYGPWHLEKCRKRCLVLRPDSCPTGCGGMTHLSACGDRAACGGRDLDFADGGEFAEFCELPNVEPFGGETLGTLAALPDLPAARPAASVGSPAQPTFSQPSTTGTPAPLPLGILPAAAGSAPRN